MKMKDARDRRSTRGDVQLCEFEDRVPADHPLRRLRVLVNGILVSMSKLLDERYSYTGRPSIPPEQLLRALLLQILF